MSYRSDVSLVMTRKLFAKMLLDIPAEIRKMIGRTSRFQTSGDAILLFWENERWDENSSPVNKIHNFLIDVDESTLDESGEEPFRYHLVRIGEEILDIEQFGGYWDNPWETEVIRHINLNGKGEDLNLESFL